MVLTAPEGGTLSFTTATGALSCPTTTVKPTTGKAATAVKVTCKLASSAAAIDDDDLVTVSLLPPTKGSAAATRTVSIKVAVSAQSAGGSA